MSLSSAAADVKATVDPITSPSGVSTFYSDVDVATLHDVKAEKRILKYYAMDLINLSWKFICSSPPSKRNIEAFEEYDAMFTVLVDRIYRNEKGESNRKYIDYIDGVIQGRRAIVQAQEILTERIIDRDSLKTLHALFNIGRVNQYGPYDLSFRTSENPFRRMALILAASPSKLDPYDASLGLQREMESSCITEALYYSLNTKKIKTVLKNGCASYFYKMFELTLLEPQLNFKKLTTYYCLHVRLCALQRSEPYYPKETTGIKFTNGKFHIEYQKLKAFYQRCLEIKEDKIDDFSLLPSRMPALLTTDRAIFEKAIAAAIGECNTDVKAVAQDFLNNLHACFKGSTTLDPTSVLKDFLGNPKNEVIVVMILKKLLQHYAVNFLDARPMFFEDTRLYRLVPRIIEIVGNFYQSNKHHVNFITVEFASNVILEINKILKIQTKDEKVDYKGTAPSLKDLRASDAKVGMPTPRIAPLAVNTIRYPNLSSYSLSFFSSSELSRCLTLKATDTQRELATDLPASAPLEFVENSNLTPGASDEKVQPFGKDQEEIDWARLFSQMEMPKERVRAEGEELEPGSPQGAMPKEPSFLPKALLA